jgi:hypothetical protein
MADLKTQPSDASVDQFIQAVPDEQRRQDAVALLALMQRITQQEPQLWGGTMVGFGRYHYTYASGRSGTWFVPGLPPESERQRSTSCRGLSPTPPYWNSWVSIAWASRASTSSVCLTWIGKF